jgi:hypothetical protein
MVVLGTVTLQKNHAMGFHFARRKGWLIIERKTAVAAPQATSDAHLPKSLDMTLNEAS